LFARSVEEERKTLPKSTWFATKEQIGLPILTGNEGKTGQF
jgi:hypothetical protein